LLEQLRVAGAPTHKAECALRTYASSLTHLLAYERKLKEEAEATKGETKLKGGHKKA
jgi:ubiquinone biosynthesis protein UbiJ